MHKAHFPLPTAHVYHFSWQCPISQDGIIVTTLQDQKVEVIYPKLEKVKLGFKLRTLITKPITEPLD